VEETERTEATDDATEADGPMRARSTTAFPYSLGLTHALHGTPSPQSLTFPPGRAGRER